MRTTENVADVGLRLKYAPAQTELLSGVGSSVTVHGLERQDSAFWRVSPPSNPPHNVADLSEFVTANSFAATLRGGGHAPAREQLRVVPGPVITYQYHSVQS